MRVISGSARGHQLKVPKGMSTRPMTDKVKSSVFSMLTNILAQLGRDWGRVLDMYSGTGSIGIEALSRGATWADFVEVNAGVCRLISENLEHTHFSDRARVNNRTVQAFLNSPPPATIKNKGQRSAGGLHRRKGGAERKWKSELEPLEETTFPQSAPTKPQTTTLDNNQNDAVNTQNERGYDIIFLDPPYADPKIPETIKHLAASGLVKPGGLVVIGHSPRVVLADSYGEDDASGSSGAVQIQRIRYRRHGDSSFSVYLAGNPTAYGFNTNGAVEDDSANDDVLATDEDLTETSD